MRPALLIFALHFFMSGALGHPASHQALSFDLSVDWWTSKFAGHRHRNIFGIVFGIALLDAIKWKLTAHSRALRCAVEANQLETTLDAIRVTH